MNCYVYVKLIIPVLHTERYSFNIYTNYWEGSYWRVIDEPVGKFGSTAKIRSQWMTNGFWSYSPKKLVHVLCPLKQQPYAGFFPVDIKRSCLPQSLQSITTWTISLQQVWIKQPKSLPPGRIRFLSWSDFSEICWKTSSEPEKKWLVSDVNPGIFLRLDFWNVFGMFSLFLMTCLYLNGIKTGTCPSWLYI